MEPKGRRGPYKKARDKAPSPADSPPMDWELCEGLIADSPLKSLKAKRSLAEAAVSQRSLIVVLRKRVEDGTITSDEARALNGACSNYRRLMEALGLTQTDEEAPDFNAE